MLRESKLGTPEVNWRLFQWTKYFSDRLILMLLTGFILCF